MTAAASVHHQTGLIGIDAPVEREREGDGQGRKRERKGRKVSSLITTLFV